MTTLLDLIRAYGDARENAYWRQARNDADWAQRRTAADHAWAAIVAALANDNDNDNAAGLGSSQRANIAPAEAELARLQAGLEHRQVLPPGQPGGVTNALLEIDSLRSDLETILRAWSSLNGQPWETHPLNPAATSAAGQDG